jgi:hypothetical protein
MNSPTGTNGLAQSLWLQLSYTGGVDRKEKKMRTILLIAGGLLVVGVVVFIAPDLFRYMKISSM